ncbi:MAG: hypothetical protein Kow0010_20590 [Dehalococcoidia bacterium]
MTARVAPQLSAPLSVIAPYFLLAPAGLLVAGVLLLGARSADFGAINHPTTLGITHAIVLGWITTTMFGATYQLGAAVLGGRTLPAWLLRAQLALHLAGVGVFVLSFREWDLAWLRAGSFVLVATIGVHLVAVVSPLRSAQGWPPIRLYLLAGAMGLAATATLGFLWVDALHAARYTVTELRISAHAHLGLVGWLGVTLMGVSYQLVPMFNVINRRKPAVPRLALGAVIAGVAAFVTANLLALPGWAIAGSGSVILAGIGAWAVDQWLLLGARSRRKMDIQGRASYVSLGFLAVAGGLAAIALGRAFLGEPLLPRLLLAYGATGTLGWMGVALIGNSYKILPFLIWYHRYRELAGREPVPLVGELYSERAAHAVVGVHSTAVVLLLAGLLTESDLLTRGAAVLLILSAVVHVASLAYMFVPRRARRSVRPATGKEVSA